MKVARCVIYDPPTKNLPSLAVVFSSQGELLATRIVHSMGSIDFIMAELMSEVRSAGGYVLEHVHEPTL